MFNVVLIIKLWVFAALAVCCGSFRMVFSPFKSHSPSLHQRNAQATPGESALLDATLTKALRTFAEQMGSKQIPKSFVVPFDSAWPPEIHGFRLGHQFGKLLLAQDKFPSASMELKALGFGNQTVVDSWEIFFGALVKFKELYGHLNVPNNFMVPKEYPWTKLEWGLKLGVKLATLRSTGKYVRIDDDRMQDLLALGFEWVPTERPHVNILWTDEIFSRIVTGLLIYRDTFPDRDISKNFTVPKTTPWPKELHGMKLGEMISVIRDCKQTGDFQTKIDRSANKVYFQKLCKAVETFKIMNGHVNISTSFVVPSSNHWLTELWGFNLGREFHSILKNSTVVDPILRKQLLSIAGEIEMEALNIDAVKTPTPVLTTNSSLRQVSNVIDKDTSDYEYQSNTGQERRAHVLLRALNSRMSSRDSRVRSVANYEGSLSCSDFSNFKFGSKPKEASQLSYRVLEFGRFSWSQVVRCLQSYRNCFGSLDVPSNYQIDHDKLDLGFPQDCTGLNLHDATNAIRVGDVDGFTDPDRKFELDSLGFRWGDPRVYLKFRFFPMWLGLKHFLYIHGHIDMQWDYVVPHSDEWPSWMMGMPLGQWLWTAKSQHALLAREYPSRKSMLDSLDIDWTIPLEVELLQFDKFHS